MGIAAKEDIVAELLDADAVADGLARLDGWTGDTAAIRRDAKLPGFRAAIDVVDRVAEIAEEMDHHPDIDIRWRTLTFTCSTHSAGGVTGKDLALAARIDQVVRSVGG
jgi:4a-hydroxytetrahydrobiopterin dehydratase